MYVIQGYYGGIRLIQATIKSFRDLCITANVNINRLEHGFRISYSSTIPRMVGLSGSSAIIVATFTALMEYYQITLFELHILRAGKSFSLHTNTVHVYLTYTLYISIYMLHIDLPEFILNIEKNELGIAAGLQDRVIQVYGGVVFMDFSNNINNSSKCIENDTNDTIFNTPETSMESFLRDKNLQFEYNSSRSCKYLPIDPAAVPHLYIAYNLAAGKLKYNIYICILYMQCYSLLYVYDLV